MAQYLIETLAEFHNFLRDHGVRSEQSTGEPIPTVEEGVSMVADLRRQLAEREAVIEKVREQLRGNGWPELAEDCSFAPAEGVSECEEAGKKAMVEFPRLLKWISELLSAPPSTVLSAHDAEVRRETIEEDIELVMNEPTIDAWGPREPGMVKAQIVSALRSRKEEK